ncbi:MAG TPA: tripartite tricarboxylate transporter substrate binding protein [Burkholderiaceae bacterium]|nr:tripartite tricarboxylate transporter substrate binding protein [Burkholderiaceae bacterium]
MKTLLRALALGAIATVAAAAPALAAYPEKPVTVVVPFPPGGSTDTIARAMANKMTASLGQTFVVENQPGATGAIGATRVKRAAPDGYTILVASIGVFATNPFLQKGLQYDPMKDFDLMMVAVRAPNVLVANPNVPVKNVAELVEYLKKNPDKVTFASSGAGSSDHLTAALFWQKTGTTGIHVPYKGGAPAISDLIAGHSQVSFQNINAVLNHIKAGKLKVLAVTGDKRSAALPDVPTLSEAGVKGADVFSWQGVAAPKGLPKDVKDKLHGAMVKALQDPDVAKNLSDQGIEVVANTPEQFTQFLQQELAKWKAVIETGKITVD